MLRASIVSFLGLLVTAHLVQSPTPTPISTLQGYRTWHLVTPEAVDMAPAIAISCAGPSATDSSTKNPHAPRLFKVYVNAIGRSAMLSEGKKPFPVGSMIVKEKFVRSLSSDRVKLAQDAKPELLTAMIKRSKGFDAPNGDWEYVVLSGDARTKTTKGLEHCASCHRSQEKSGYVFGRYGAIRH